MNISQSTESIPNPVEPKKSQFSISHNNESAEPSKPQLSISHNNESAEKPVLQKQEFSIIHSIEYHKEVKKNITFALVLM